MGAWCRERLNYWMEDWKFKANKQANHVHVWSLLTSRKSDFHRSGLEHTLTQARWTEKMHKSHWLAGVTSDRIFPIGFLMKSSCNRKKTRPKQSRYLQEYKCNNNNFKKDKHIQNTSMFINTAKCSKLEHVIKNFLLFSSLHDKH